jgi:cytochrome c
MSTPKSFLLLATLTLSACVSGPGSSMSATAPSAPLGIGRLATADEIRGWDIDVDAEGRGLPPGRGTVAAGKVVYDAKCAACHGATGTGGPAPALAGGIGTITTPKPIRTVGSFWPYAPPVYDYINRSMPWDKPLSLTPDEVYAVTGYVLHLNKIVPADAVMDAKSLAAVRMPNRDGFVTLPKDPEIPGVRCMSNCP